MKSVILIHLNFDLPSLCHAQSGICNSLNNGIDSLLVSVKPLEKLCPCHLTFLLFFQWEGKKRTASTLVSLNLVHYKGGECTLIPITQIRLGILFLNAPLSECQNVLRQFL